MWRKNWLVPIKGQWNFGQIQSGYVMSPFDECHS